nr:OadG family protein [Maliibacterium massiliense]
MENLGYGLTISAIGFAIVFAVLVVLIFAIKLMTLVLGGKKGEPAKAPAAAPPAQAAPVADPTAVTPEAFAAITGALAASMKKDAGQLVVRSVKRVDK